MEMFLTLFYATLAKWLMRVICNLEIVGSSPTGSLHKHLVICESERHFFGRESHSKS